MLLREKVPRFRRNPRGEKTLFGIFPKTESPTRGGVARVGGGKGGRSLEVARARRDQGEHEDEGTPLPPLRRNNLARAEARARTRRVPRRRESAQQTRCRRENSARRMSRRNQSRTRKEHLGVFRELRKSSKPRRAQARRGCFSRFEFFVEHKVRRVLTAELSAPRRME